MKALICVLCFVGVIFAQPNPDTLWTAQFGSDMDEMVTALCPDAQGRYVLTGYCGYNGDEMGPQDMFVIRRNADGSADWSQIISVPEGYEFAFGLCATANGHTVLAGEAYPNDLPEFQFAVILRLDENGDEVFAYTYDESYEPRFNTVAELPSEDLIAAGYDYVPTLNANALLVRLNQAGDTVWTRSFGDEMDDYVTDMVLTPNGQIVLSGVAFEHPPAFGHHVELMCADTNGNLLWTRRYDAGPPQAWLSTETHLALLPNGDLALGLTTSGVADMVVWLMRTTSSGDSLWTRWYSFDEYTSETWGICPGAGGGIVAVAGVGSYPAYEIVLMKAEDDGDLAWQQSYVLDDGSMVISDVRLGDDSTYLISGTCFNSANQANALMIMTGPEIIETGGSTFTPYPSSFALSVYPNPFNSSTTLSFTVPQSVEASMVLFDIMGREVMRLAAQRFDAGEHRVTLAASSFASGVYFAVLKSDQVLATHKLLLLK